MKIFVLVAILFGFFWEAAMVWLDARWQRTHALPECVRDVYDETEYKRWRQYDTEKTHLMLVANAVQTIVLIVLFVTNAFAGWSKILPENEYANALLLLASWTFFSGLISMPFSYINDMKIEEKYGFNRSTKKTFFGDWVKNLILSLILMCGLTAVAIACYHAMGNAFFLVVYGVLVAVMLVVSTFSLAFMKIFNKFEPLEEGELRSRLTSMFEENGYKLKNIYVMNASKRTTKANAFCAGLGKFKEIALYDNLVNEFSEDEILAVFAHELTHFKHSDTRHQTLLSLLRFLPVALLILLLAAVPACMTQLGFDKLNFGMVILTVFEAVATPVMLLSGIPINAFSRFCERRADSYPATLGLGEALVSALKKLARKNFSDLNPDPLHVKLEYSHPPIAERIQLIRSK